MAANTELMIRIAADIRQAKDALNSLAGQFRSVGNGSDAAAAATERLTGKIKTMGHVGGGLVALNVSLNAIGAAFRNIATAADGWDVVNAKMRLASGNSADFVAIQGKVFAIAQAAGARFQDVGEVYAKVAKGAEALGLSQQRVLGVTETIANAMRLMGGSSAGASAALNQFGQALSSGQLRGEELNSVLEQLPTLADAIARGMNRSTGELRNLAQSGRLTVEEIVIALEKSAPEVARLAKIMPLTFSAGMAVLGNETQRYVAMLNQAVGASKLFNSGVRDLAENINAVAAVALGALSVAFGRLLSASVGLAKRHLDAAGAARLQAVAEANLALQSANAARIMAIADKQAAAASIARADAALAEAVAERALLAQMAVYGPARARVETQIAQATLARKAAAEAAAGAEARLVAAGVAAQTAGVALANAGRAATFLRGALAFLGGPIGLLTTLIGLGATAWLTWGNNAEKAAEKTKNKIASLSDRIREVNGELEAMNVDRNLLDAREAELSALRGKQAALGVSMGKTGSPVLPGQPTAKDTRALTEWFVLQNQIVGKARELEQARKVFAEKGVRGSTRAFIEAGLSETEQAAAKIKVIREQFEREKARLDKRDPAFSATLAALEKSRDEQIRQATPKAAKTKGGGDAVNEAKREAERESEALLKAQQELQKNLAEAEAQGLTDHLDARKELLDQRRKAELIDEETFIRARLALDEEGLRNELAALQAQRNKLRAASAERGAKGSEKTQALGDLALIDARIVSAQQKILNLNQAADAALAAVTAERNRLLELQGQIRKANADKQAAEDLKRQQDDLYQSVQQGVQRAFADGLNAVASGEGGIRGALQNLVNTIRNALSNALAASLTESFLGMLGGKEGVLNIAGVFGFGGKKRDGSSQANAIYVQDVAAAGAQGSLASGIGSQVDSIFGRIGGMFSSLGSLLSSSFSRLFGLLSSGFSRMFSGGGGGLGGFFSGLFGGGGFGGGYDYMSNLGKPGMGWFDTPTFGFYADGGFTGPGGKYTPAGVVHRGEYVFPQEAVRRIGVHTLANLQRFATGAFVPRGPRLSYADGGLVNLPSQAAPVVNSSTRVVNLFDPSQVAGELGKTREFERAVLNVIQLNPRALQGGF